MQRVTILCVGSLKEKYLREALEEYLRRLTPLCNVKLTELAETKLPDKPSDAQIAAGMADEGKRILAALPEGSDVVALCVEGKELSSPELADYMERSAAKGKNGVCFVIGGSHGLADEVKKRADLRLSFSRLTFPHQLFRVMLTEQIYRAYMIRNGTKYHK